MKQVGTKWILQVIGNSMSYFLIEILIPRRTPNGPVEQGWFDAFMKELTASFGGVTGFLRSPAKGLWNKQGDIEKDSVMIIEVMASDLDQRYWRRLKNRVEQDLQQEEIVVRATAIERL